jgi:hypothetical protein
MKDYGHYGPHSANDRPRRRADWKPLFEEYILTARFEEWTLAGTSPRRTVQTCEYNSVDTKLWHKDDFGDMFVKVPPLGRGVGHGCPVPGCYYHQLRPPENCHTTLFKTINGLQEHHRRAHDAMPVALPSAIAFQSQLHQDKERGSIGCSDTMAPTNDPGNIALSSTPQADQPWLTDLDPSFGTHNFESVQCFNPGCIQCRRTLQGDQQAESCVSDGFYLGDQSIGYCRSCFQREPTSLQPGRVLSLPGSGLSSHLEFSSLLSSSTTYATTGLPTLNISKDNMQTASSTANANISSLSREDSLKLRYASVNSLTLLLELNGCLAS